jgi:hypothetical protein
MSMGLTWTNSAVTFQPSPRRVMVDATHGSLGPRYLRVSTGAGHASGDRQRPARLRRLLERLDEVVSKSCGQAKLVHQGGISISLPLRLFYGFWGSEIGNFGVSDEILAGVELNKVK